jgi:ABC-type nitrate/sulfonate/bicarbonate transport system substrate-binding protein
MGLFQQAAREISVLGMPNVAKASLAVLLLLLWSQASMAATGVEIIQDRKVPLLDRFAAATKSPDESRKELREIMFGLPSLGMTSFAVQIASDKGFFARRNLKVTMISARSSVIMAALVSGNMQFSNSTGSATRAALQGLPVRVIAYFQTEPFSLVVRPEINSISDLKGKTIGLAELTSNNGVYLAHALELGKLSLRDIKHLNMTDQGRVQGLLSRQIDGAVTSPPRTQQLEAEGMRVLTGPEISDIPSNGLVTTVRLLEREPELVQSMLDALVDAVVWARSNPEASVPYFANKYKLPASIASAAYKQQMQVLRWNQTDQQLQKAIKVALQAVGTSQRAQIADAVDLTNYREILRRRGLAD